jgi:hypothetical protein
MPEPLQLDIDGDEQPLGALGGATAPAERPPKGPGALCKWCGDPIPDRSRSGRRTRADAETCGRKCRQSSHRFGNERAPASGGDTRPMRFAYADPPYPGFAHLYADHPDYGGEVDHAALIARLVADYPDGWALSTSSKTLRQVLALIPPAVDVRLGAWTKPMPPRKGLRARCAWEPVIFCGGRPTEAYDLLDWVYAATPRAYPGHVIGAKPSQFAWWVFRCLGARQGDQLDDLFPGSGAIARAWGRYQSAVDGERVA